MLLSMWWQRALAVSLCLLGPDRVPRPAPAPDADTQAADRLASGAAPGVDGELLWDEPGLLDTDSLAPPAPGRPGYLAGETDSDSDGIPDDMERTGVAGQSLLDFPAYGADPSVPDVFVQVDWITCDPIVEYCGPNNSFDAYQMSPRAAVEAASFYAPDVAAHFDIGVAPLEPAHASIYGDWRGAHRLPPGVPTCNEKSLGPRHGTFHRGAVQGYGGGGQGLILAFCYTADTDHGSVSAHELGHNLGLQHGGSVDSYLINCKPNHRSPMNYAYLYDRRVTRFSRGELVRPLDPTAMDELRGLDTTDADILASLRGSPWHLDVRDDGAIDWNRDGRFDTAPVRAAPNWAWSSCEQSVAHTDVFAGASHAGATWLPTQPTPRIVLFTRSREGGALGMRSATRFDRCDLGNAGEACTDWEPPSDEPALAVPGALPGPGAVAAIAWQEDSSVGTLRRSFLPERPGARLLAVYIDKEHRLLGQTMTVLPGSEPSWTAPTVIDTGPIDDDPALVLLPDPAGAAERVLLLAPRQGRLSAWERAVDQASFTGPVDQVWDDGTPVRPCAGVALARGHETGVAGEGLYAAIPSGDLCTIEFARRAPGGAWIRGGDAVWSGPPPLTDAQPGLAYVPFGSDPGDGRFYLAWRPYPVGAGQIAFTQGNDRSPGATERRLQFWPGAYMLNLWARVHDSVGLLYDPRFDTNLRAVWSYADRDARFQPFADGIVEAEMRDLDEYAIIRASLACSLTRSCP